MIIKLEREFEIHCESCGRDLSELTTVKNCDSYLEMEVGVCQNCQEQMDNRVLKAEREVEELKSEVKDLEKQLAEKN